MFFNREKKISDTIIAYRKLFDCEEGTRVLHDLIRSCWVLTSTFDPNPNEMIYREGERAVVLRILRTLNTDPERILKMMEEGREQEAQYDNIE